MITQIIKSVRNLNNHSNENNTTSDNNNSSTNDRGEGNTCDVDGHEDFKYDKDCDEVIIIIILHV